MVIVITGRIPSKKNSRITTRSGKSFPSKKYTSWHKIAEDELMQQSPKKYANIESVTIWFILPDNRRADLTNKAESIMDLLVDCGVIEDDSWQHVPKITLISLGKNKDLAGCRIKIEEAE